MRHDLCSVVYKKKYVKPVLREQLRVYLNVQFFRNVTVGINGYSIALLSFFSILLVVSVESRFLEQIFISLGKISGSPPPPPPPDFSKQISFPLEVQEIGIVLYIVFSGDY